MASVKNPPNPHTIAVPPGGPAGTFQNYYAVKRSDGRELIRCATLDEAMKEQARLDRRDSYTIR